MNGKQGSEEAVEPAPLTLRPDLAVRDRGQRVAPPGVGRWMRARLDDVVAAILAALREEVPSYRGLSGRALERFRSDLASHVLSFIDLAVEGRSYDRKDLEALARLSWERLRLGIPLEDLLLAHHVGTRVALEYLDAALQATGAMDPAVGSAVRTTARRLATQVASAILDTARAFAAEPPSGADLTARWLDDLLDPSSSPDRAARCARERGIRLSKPTTVAVVGYASHEGGAVAGESLRVALAPGLPGAVVGRRDGFLVCVIPGEVAIEQLEAVFGAAIRDSSDLGNALVFAAIGSTGIGWPALLRSHAEAVEVARLLARLPSLPKVLSFRRALPYRILDVLPSLGEERGMQVIEPLREAPELLATVECFLEEGRNASRAAETLGVDRKTFYARVGRIKDLTGVLLTDPKNHFQIELSVAARRVAAAAEKVSEVP